MSLDSHQDAAPKRNRPGTKNADLFSWNYSLSHNINPSPKGKNAESNTTKTEKKDTPDGEEADEDFDIIDDDSNSNFASQELIQRNIQHDPSKVEKIISLPEGSNEEQDRDAWIYEQMRQFLLELNHFIVAHAQVCTKDTQPEMKITGVKSNEELVFLSPIFNPPQPVPAIDYMIQIVTQASQTLNDTKIFPNRISISKKGLKETKTLTRRLYRLFAFSYYVHPEEWTKFEKETHLSERYQKFLKLYDLMQKKQFLIPDKAFKSTNK
ncbi:MOB-like protein phocein [Acrasis kona]|uniref:MOB-like protein phocein n=1 Tax=Acrasis kona TaxID=1008807 RepID=A0AAW2ZCV7_9EUKA